MIYCVATTWNSISIISSTTTTTIKNTSTIPTRTALEELQLLTNPITTPPCNPPIPPMMLLVVFSPNPAVLTQDHEIINDNYI